MLLNFTNHPFETWDSAQQDAAIQEFDEVIDFQFLME